MTGEYQNWNTSLGNVLVGDNTCNQLAMNPTATKGWQFYDYQTELDKLANKTKQEKTSTQPKMKEKKMAIDKNKRGLFQVILIDPKEKKMLMDKIVIADSVEDVLLEVDAGSVIKTAGLAVADVDKIVNIIGQVRKTRKNKNGEVEIINEEIKE